MMSALMEGVNLSLLNQVDSVCDEFEAAWQSGASPRAEDYLFNEISAVPLLLQSLLTLEIEYRTKRGELVKSTELALRFPEHTELIESLQKSIRLPTTLGRNVAEDAGPKVPRTVGRFELKTVLGIGSSGTVYLAEDASLGRIVALKVAHPYLFGTSASRERFIREAKNVARLSYPGIVPVFEVGTADGQSYIVGEYVAGPTLASVAKERSDFRAIAGLTADIADALHYAHGKGIIHRDLKPSNVLLALRDSADGRSLSDYQARIVDFGLARRTDAQTILTGDGDVLGTPAYMSPEQAAGESKRVDARGDIFSLGVILYELLTGEVPFRGKWPAILDRIIHQPPRPPSKINIQVPCDLEVICLKCLEKAPELRYTTMAALAKDLRCWLGREPISARPISPFRKAVRQVRRYPRVTVIATAFLVLCVALATVWQQSHMLRAQRLQEIVSNLMGAAPGQLKGALGRARASLPSIDRELTSIRSDEERTQRERFLAGLALLPSAPENAVDLIPGLLQSSTDEFDVLCEELRLYREAIAPVLWHRLQESAATHPVVVRAACALVLLDPGNPLWEAEVEHVCWSLASLPPSEIRHWAPKLRLGKDILPNHLQALARHPVSAGSGRGAAQALAAIRPDQVNVLCELLVKGNDNQFRILLDALRPHRDDAVASLLRRLEQITESVKSADNVSEAEIIEQSTVSLALIELGYAERIWQLWTYAVDPRLQTYLIQRYSELGLDPNVLATTLMTCDADQSGLPYALALALGSYTIRDLDRLKREKILSWLDRNYCEHADPGVHCAIRWLLQRWGRGPQLRPLDEALMEQGSKTDRRWYLNKLGQLIVVMQKGMPFVLGDSEDRKPQTQHVLQHSFAVAAEETTWQQYSRLMPTPTRPDNVSDDQPITGVSWFEAIEFCRRLSRLDGADPDTIQVTDGPQLHASIDFLKVGYRLPRDFEWECAARGGTKTSRFWGTQETPYLDRYVWHIADANRTIPVASLYPNPFGMFDCYGNASEWTASFFNRAQDWTEKGRLLGVHATAAMNHRGGDWTTLVSDYQSTMSSPYRANRQAVPAGRAPVKEFTFIGFRVARSMPDN